MAQPPSSEVAESSGPPQPHLEEELTEEELTFLKDNPTHTLALNTRSHTPAQEGRSGAESSTTQGGGTESLVATQDKPPTSDLSKSEWLRRQGSEVNQYSRGKNLRDRPRVSYMEEPQDDHYFYCDECRSFFIEECEVHGPPVFIMDTHVVLGVPDRARLTLPHGLEVRRSRIPGAGLGVFNCGKTVAPGTHYGPYEGEVTNKKAIESGYSWIYKSRNCDMVIDAKTETHSNWMRYVNCARSEEEQNLVAFQYRGGILYRCSRLLSDGEELLVWYGEEYAKDLGISSDLWNNKRNTRGVMSKLSPQASMFSCSKCPFSNTSQIYLHKHIKRSHDDLYATMLMSGEIGPETLSSSSSRSLPITTTSTPLTPDPVVKQREMDKPRSYHCDQCGKNFTKRNHLRTHQNVHTGEKLYNCDQCGKKFGYARSLKAHQHVHSTGGKLYNCDQCGKKFVCAASLKSHQRVHTGAKPYHCDKCGKNFSRVDHLREHQRVQTCEKPYHCDKCGKNFTREDNLRTHQNFHTVEQAYHCDKCGKNFGYPSLLKKHRCSGKSQDPVI